MFCYQLSYNIALWFQSSHAFHSPTVVHPTADGVPFCKRVTCGSNLLTSPMQPRVVPQRTSIHFSRAHCRSGSLLEDRNCFHGPHASTLPRNEPDQVLFWERFPAINTRCHRGARPLLLIMLTMRRRSTCWLLTACSYQHLRRFALIKGSYSATAEMAIIERDRCICI